MTDAATLARCLSYVGTQIQPGTAPQRHLPPPTVTISRLTGSGGLAVARALSDWLERHRPGKPAPWTVFDRALVERMLAEHHLPSQLARFIPEARVSYIQDTVEELLGLHPSTTSLVTQVTETILGLAELGNCILVGRGAHVVLARTPTAFHVRLVSPLPRRIERIAADRHLDESAAAEYIRHEDAARARYLKTHLDANIDDPLGYHLVLNMEWFDPEAAAETIGQALLRRFPAPR